MNGRGSSHKGSSFERKIARELSLWLTKGEDHTQLIRSVLSGGWTSGQRGDPRQVGDLAANGPVGEAFRKRFAVECKHRKDIDLYGLWTQTKNADALVGWWMKLRKDAEAVGVEPLLIFRSNRMPIMVGRPWKSGMEWFGVHFGALNLAIYPFAALLAHPPEDFL